jgi:hypothetical protein
MWMRCFPWACVRRGEVGRPWRISDMEGLLGSEGFGGVQRGLEGFGWCSRGNLTPLSLLRRIHRFAGSCHASVWAAPLYDRRRELARTATWRRWSCAGSDLSHAHAHPTPTPARKLSKFRRACCLSARVTDECADAHDYLKMRKRCEADATDTFRPHTSICQEHTQCQHSASPNIQRA